MLPAPLLPAASMHLQCLLMGTHSTANIPHPDLEKELMYSAPTDFTGEGTSNALLVKVCLCPLHHTFSQKPHFMAGYAPGESRCNQMTRGSQALQKARAPSAGPQDTAEICFVHQYSQFLHCTVLPETIQ